MRHSENRTADEGMRVQGQIALGAMRRAGEQPVDPKTSTEPNGASYSRCTTPYEDPVATTTEYRPAE